MQTESSSTFESEILAKAEVTAIIERFQIVDLYGYRTVSIDTPHLATIIIAQNGAGKTTVLSALHAVLKGQFNRLNGIDFKRIEIKLKDMDVLSIEKADIDQFSDRQYASEFLTESAKLDIPPSELFNFLTTEFSAIDAPLMYYESTTIFDKIVAKCGYSLPKGIERSESIIQILYSETPNLANVRIAIQNSMAGIDVLYLPTYRRIELALEEDDKRLGSRRARPNIRFAKGALNTGDIKFGLSDIPDLLSKLNTEIVSESNNGYRQISANIISDLIGGRFSGTLPSPGELPSEDDLRIFFSRLSESSRHGRFPPLQIPNLDQIYTGRTAETPNNQFLDYFLSKLNDVILVVKNIENYVDSFVTTCNRYLGSSDTSTASGTTFRERSQPIDAKELIINRNDLSVSIRSIFSKIMIPLDSLSSGEKQMVSLFAKMYLQPTKKIVLIDEPELSLSLDWQSHILPDIMMAPSCSQMIAITHSPFVFENQLEPFARPMKLELSPPTVDELDLT